MVSSPAFLTKSEPAEVLAWCNREVESLGHSWIVGEVESKGKGSGVACKSCVTAIFQVPGKSRIKE